MLEFSCGHELFSKIIDKSIPADIIYEDDICIAFRDIAPQAPVHFLVVPRKPIERIATLAEEDESIVGHIHTVIAKLAESENIGDAFRVVSNSGADAGQSVFHLHFHVLGGRTLAWPPG